MLTPSCPVSLVVSVLFISTDHCISVIGMSMTVSLFPPSVRMSATVPL
ncbi:unnamed protein product [Staurois parvus]|uniref:Uncharacterized protein n=1 Tax=Staurois parvus TaxID=386267 RepID=A0ABN9D6F0_9NEOB|nr:unnamed protein product [Staurois parvus]